MYKDVVIVIPVYKSSLDENEILSFKQCLNILNKYTICIVTYESLSIEYYKCQFDLFGVDYCIKYFDAIYFKNTIGYNHLMTSKCFYKSFEEYKYMLVYQLDAYVFKDELEVWCAKGFDLIGAPLIEDKYGVENKYFLKGMNGGLSLRNIGYCIRLLSYKGPVLRPNAIWKIVKNEFPTDKFKMLFYYISRSLGRQNTLKYFTDKYYINEDLLFTLTLHVSWVNNDLQKGETWIYPNLPGLNDALKFAFERYPRFMFEINNKELPFGCHAWEKYEYDSFWKKYIEE
ncbi:MAG: DUF5672 family protein [Paludibacter sp.]